MKTTELRAKSDLDLASVAKTLQEEVFKLRFKASVSTLENTARLGLARKDLARVLTLIRERKTSEVVKP